MSERSATSRPVHENLDTTYVNVAALIRYLQGRSFQGRIHVELDEYDADVFLAAGNEPRVRETDHRNARTAEGEAALQRLLVRSREPGGLVSVYEGNGEEAAGEEATAMSAGAVVDERASASASPEEAEWSELVRLSGELI